MGKRFSAVITQAVFVALLAIGLLWARSAGSASKPAPDICKSEHKLYRARTFENGKPYCFEHDQLNGAEFVIDEAAGVTYQGFRNPDTHEIAGVHIHVGDPAKTVNPGFWERSQIPADLMAAFTDGRKAYKTPKIKQQ